MKVLVTGHRGFIGRHIFRSLEADHDVVGIDRLDPSGLVDEDCDLGNITDLPRVDLVVHCAALADISQNHGPNHNRNQLWWDNVDCTRQLLDRIGPARVIFLSTLAVYGPTSTEEDGVTFATSPYAASKIAGESLVQAHAHHYGVDHKIFRLGCVVGEGYSHGHIADYVRQHRTSGGISPKSNGSAKRSHVHVADVGQAVSLAVISSMNSGTYNVCSGTWSCRDTVRAMGVEASWPHNEDAWVGDQKIVANNVRLRGQGWLPQKSIEHGVLDSLRSLGWNAAK